MRIVVDARSVRRRRSGIGNYTEQLLRHLVPLAGEARFLVLRHPEATEPVVRDERVREAKVPGRPKSPLGSIAPMFAPGLSRFDLYHAPGDVLPVALRCPSVVTVHDLMWLEAPRLAAAFPPSRIVNGLWFRANLRHSIAQARSVIAVSNATARAIVRWFPEAAAKVRVVHHGVDANRNAAAGADRTALRRLLPDRCTRFSLAVGQGSPYKNHAATVRAFVEATRDDPGHVLALVRRFVRFDVEMRRLLRRSEVRKKIVALPHMGDESLLHLYRCARMLLFLSHYEGFGLPLVEAMSVGTPILASTAAAVREVSGDAALHVPPTDHHAIVAAIRRLDRDEALRARLVAAGVRRVSHFTWTRCARATLEVYNDTLSAPRPAGGGTGFRRSRPAGRTGPAPSGQRPELLGAG